MAVKTPPTSVNTLPGGGEFNMALTLTSDIWSNETGKTTVHYSIQVTLAIKMIKFGVLTL
jgi:hypothetical protein